MQIEHMGGSFTFTLTLEGREAMVIGGSLQLSDESLRPPGLPFQWDIIPDHPPTANTFIVNHRGEEQQESWFIVSTEGDQAVEVPVTIREVPSSIVIVPC